MPPQRNGSKFSTDTTSLWPYGAVWSDSNKNANSVQESAGVAIFMGKLARDAHYRAIKLLGHGKAILNISPRLLAIRLIFLDAHREKVQFLVASAYAPPVTTDASYAEKIAVSSKTAMALYGPVGLAPDLSELEIRRAA